MESPAARFRVPNCVPGESTFTPQASGAHWVFGLSGTSSAAFPPHRYRHYRIACGTVALGQA